MYMCVGVCVIISLFLSLREFTRVKWSENENEFLFFGELSLFLSFSKRRWIGWISNSK